MDLGRLHRVLRLLTLLQSGSARSTDDLCEALAVQRRTLFRDLRLLRAAGLDYRFQKSTGYTVTDGFFLPPVNLKVAEVMGLMMLAKTASHQKHQPLAAHAVEAVRKLVATMPPPIRQVCLEMMRRVTIRPAPAVRPNGDSDHHALLQRAIDQRRVVRMTYLSLFDSPGGKQIEVTLDPYHLHFGARAWYVIGRSAEHGDVRTYKLLRIRSIEITDRAFRNDHPFDIDKHLGAAWQMIPEGKVNDIELEFSPKMGTNVSEVHWHDSQKHTLLPDGRCLMSFKVDGLSEISWWLAGYANHVKVLKPAPLRDRMIQMHRAALENYDSGMTGAKARVAGAKAVRGRAPVRRAPRNRPR